MYNSLNTAKITEKQQAVSGIITEMNQVILFLLILACGATMFFIIKKSEENSFEFLQNFSKIL